VYVPPVAVVNVHGTGAVADITAHVCGSTCCSVHAPLANTAVARVAVTTTARPAAAAPSMPVTIASTTSGSPRLTNVCALRSPTHPRRAAGA
jgi:hypothetical protein